MISFEDFVQPASIGEAYALLIEKKHNAVLGGGAFLRLGSARLGTAIDLAKLALDYIKVQDGCIEIGATTTLRSVETNPVLLTNFDAILPKAVGNVLGVQFRNVVTIGATVYSRYGFSDLLPALLALDTEVELYKAGRISLKEFMGKAYAKDILTRIFIKQDGRKAVYQSLRPCASDFPLLNVAVSLKEREGTIVVGARPQRAMIAESASALLSTGEIERAAATAAAELSFGDNMRATAEYRRAMCEVLVKRAITEVLAWK